MKKRLVLVFIVSLVFFIGYFIFLMQRPGNAHGTFSMNKDSDRASDAINVAGITIKGFSLRIGTALESLPYPEFLVELLLTDPQGRKTGYDFATGSRIETIPNGVYGDHSNSGMVSPGVYEHGAIIKKISIMPITSGAGTYRLNVTGTGSGIYALSISANDDKDRLFFKDETDIISKNVVHLYRLDYDPANAEATKITKEISHSQVQQCLQTAFDLKWIDNGGVLNSLMQKIKNDEAVFARGQRNTEVNELQAFINEVEAQKGRHIKKEAAEILADDARTLINGIK